MRFPWEDFLAKMHRDGGNPSEAHASSLLRAFYRYLIDKRILIKKEELLVLKERHRETRAALQRSRDRCRELKEIVKGEKHDREQD